MNINFPIFSPKRLCRTTLMAFVLFLATLFSFEQRDCSAQELAEPSSAPQVESAKESDTPEAETTEAPAIVTFGHRQLEQMLDDRPGMRESIPDSHPIRNAIVEGLNGKVIGQRAYWVDTDTKRAFHARPWKGYPPYITIPKNAKSSPIDKWVFALFEIYNLEGDFDKVYLDALKGKIDKEEYVKKCVEFEAEAGKKIKEFFSKHPLPASPKDIVYNYYFDKDHPEYEERQLGITTDNTAYFSRGYDSRVAPYLKRVKAYEGRIKAYEGRFKAYKGELKFSKTDQGKEDETIYEQQMREMLEKLEFLYQDE